MPDNTNPTINQDLTQIRTAVYGRDVREAIADGIEHCYNDNTSAIAQAVSAASEAQTAIQNVNTVLGQAQTALQQANTAAATATAAASNINATAAKETDGPYTISVTNSAGNTTTIEIPDPAAEVKKKANLEAVTVKKTVGPANALTFQDGVDAPAVKTTIRIEPKQDLHGYDYPWVGGAGKNMFKTEWFATRSAGGLESSWNDDGTLHIVGTASAGIRYSASLPNVVLPAGTYKFGWNTISPVAEAAVSPHVRTSTGNSAEIADANGVFTSDGVTPLFFAFVVTNNAEYTMDMKPMLFEYTEGMVEPEWEPYENICPIEGYEEVVVSNSGINTIPPFYGMYTDQTLISSEGEVQPHGSYKAFLDYIPVMPGGVYAAQWTLTANNNLGWTVAEYDANKVFIQRQSFLPATSRTAGTYRGLKTLSNSTRYVRYSMPRSNAITNTIFEGPYATEDITEYVAPAEYSISLASVDDGTVYGGTIELNEDGSGTVTVDKVIHKLSDFTWNYSDSISAFRTASTNSNAFDGSTSLNGQTNRQAFSSSYKLVNPTSAANFTNGFGDSVISIGASLSVYRILVRDNRFEGNVNDFIEAMGDEEICYELLNPTIVPLTATQIQTLVGTNHVWTDAGEITLQYRSDKYAELERRINALEAMLLEQPFDGSVEG